MEFYRLLVELLNLNDPHTAITLIRKAETKEAVIFSILDAHSNEVNFAVDKNGKVGYPEDIIPD